MAGDRGRASTLGVVIAAVIAVVFGIIVVNARDSPAGPGPAAATSAPDVVSPLTGRGGDAGRAVLAVKVDNSPEGRPWTGVGDADVVYVEPVEGGLTRLLAVFASQLPPTVGPVRSLRESDLDLLAAYGRPALAYSGNAPELDAAVSAASIVPLSAERVAGAYRRAGDRPSPHNLYGDPAALVDAARDVSGPRDVGFRFGPVPDGAPAAADVTQRVGRTEVLAHWTGDRWDLTIGGAPADAHPATIVVQHVPVRTSAIRDVAGSPSPTAVTVGSGRVEVLRDGHRLDGSWSRSAPDAPTAFTTPDGAPLPFAPGPVWVLLVAT
ncbi:DUF3048 domain-containing protein [Actinomycetospora termitidis]|uniref:DUF3048 domain-containing protein n=1 Tax=Actinomycetospora termitidis TaxID=3053470 RepID=A0ABT7M1S0_9PSEU|nr:DUF3048 domain-containing protein [Actinomycetospora sp. Odt1-22]MDL5154599.1 DUF3048 domain-containing protein [Actinomycetospora sp. Odt1-22]